METSISGFDEAAQRRNYRVLGSVCAAAGVALLVPSVRLHCVIPALWAGGVSLIAGALFGGALAMVTRTMRPMMIYTWLAGAAIAVLPISGYQMPIPLLSGAWPSNDTYQSAMRQLNSSTAEFYIEAVRLAIWLLAVPYPFARLGHHAPDYYVACDQCVESDGLEVTDSTKEQS